MGALYVYPPVDGDKEYALLKRAVYLFEAHSYDDDIREWLIHARERLAELERVNA